MVRGTFRGGFADLGGLRSGYFANRGGIFKNSLRQRASVFRGRRVSTGFGSIGYNSRSNRTWRVNRVGNKGGRRTFSRRYGPSTKVDRSNTNVVMRGGGGGRGRTRGVRGGSRGGARGGRGQASSASLNADLDAYMGEETTKSRLDSQLDAYFGRGNDKADIVMSDTNAMQM